MSVSAKWLRLQDHSQRPWLLNGYGKLATKLCCFMWGFIIKAVKVGIERKAKIREALFSWENIEWQILCRKWGDKSWKVWITPKFLISELKGLVPFISKIFIKNLLCSKTLPDVGDSAVNLIDQGLSFIKIVS